MPTPLSPRSDGSRRSSGVASIGSTTVNAVMDENTSVLKIALETLRHGSPLGLAAVAQFMIGTILVAMVGKMVGVVELGATSLAFGLINATAYSFASGFSGALETVLSHTYGRDPKSKLYGVYAQRMALLLLIVSACLGPILAFADSLLEAIGQNADVVYFTGVFCRIALFGVYPVNMLEILRRYFACQHLNNPLSISLVTSAALFPLLLYPMIKVFGYVGAPIGWVILMIGMPASLLVYLVKTGLYKATWGGWDSSALHHWGPLLKLALPSMAMMLSEWVSLEINAITAGFAPAQELAAFSVMYQSCGVWWSLTSGIFIEAAVMVGNALGQGKPGLARRCAHVCVTLAGIHGVLNMLVIFIFRRYIPLLFSDDQEVIDLYGELIPYFTLYHIFDCVQSSMMGVLRGCGKQIIGSIAIALVYSVVGVPLGIFLFMTTNLSVRALWLGPAIGVTCVGFPIYMYMLFCYIKWDEIEVGEDDISSVDSSIDRHNMSMSQYSFPVFTPMSSDREEGADTRDPEARRTSGEGEESPSRARTAPPTPAPEPLQPQDRMAASTSFTAHFHIPNRNILITPSFTAPVTPMLSPRAGAGASAFARRMQVSGSASRSRPGSPHKKHDAKKKEGAKQKEDTKKEEDDAPSKK